MRCNVLIQTTNSRIEPLEAVLKSTTVEQAQLLLSDRPENDFSTLCSTITKWNDELKEPPSIFISLVPRSFYRPVVPPDSVHVGFSLACLHHLDRVPDLPHDNDEAKNKDILRSQAHSDLRTFLNLRAREVKKDGWLVLSLVSEATSGRPNYQGPVDACRAALGSMIADGELPLAVAKSFRVPTYDRTMQDVRETLADADVGRSWGSHELFEDQVVHPAFDELERRRREGEAGYSMWYADVVIDWFMAVVSGYFLKAMRMGGSFSEDDMNSLLQDWIQRTKHLFLQNHKDQEVFCSFIYIRLKRL